MAKKAAAKASASRTRASRTVASKRAAGARSSGNSRSKKLTKITTDHDEIQRWADARDANPARVKGTGNKGDPGMIRMDLPGYSGSESLEQISWEEFFEVFERNQLAFVYQDKTAAGRRSNFNKLVSRGA